MSILTTTTAAPLQPLAQPPERTLPRNPFAYARDFLNQQSVYLSISAPARGLFIGIDLNPDQRCTLNCLYREVDQSVPEPPSNIDCEVAQRELEQTLDLVSGRKILDRAPYRSLPSDLLALRHVALSGDGEPTISPNFLELVQTVLHVRARALYPFFKIVLMTNASHLNTPQVQAALSLFTLHDEIWARVDPGTAVHLNRTDTSRVPLVWLLDNILFTASNRPVIIQSLFSIVDGHAPTTVEISQYAGRLKELKNAGANIPLVQVCSATCHAHRKTIPHLPLCALRQIADAVRNIAGLRAEVF